jgi:hypothetical protein
MLTFIKKPLSKIALRQFIAKALDKGWVRESFHSEVERAHRNISDEDVRVGLERKDWIIIGEPEVATNGFKYLIRTADVDDEVLHLLILPNLENATLKIITKY